jgi:uncharacterized membrane protein (UPF0127 family)
MILLKNNKKIIDHLKIANKFFTRIKGLLGKRSMNKECCLFIPNCNSVHTFFMKFSIDIVMTDSDFRVVCVKECVRPFKIIICLKASHTFEFISGIIRKKRIK